MVQKLSLKIEKKKRQQMVIPFCHYKFLSNPNKVRSRITVMLKKICNNLKFRNLIQEKISQIDRDSVNKLLYSQ